MTDNVISRAAPSDDFTVGAADPSGTTISSDASGPSPSTGGTTGTVVVLPTTGGNYTLSETPTAGSGTQLSAYAISWACTENGSPLSVTPRRATPRLQ